MLIYQTKSEIISRIEVGERKQTNKLKKVRKHNNLVYANARFKYLNLKVNETL